MGHNGRRDCSYLNAQKQLKKLNRQIAERLLIFLEELETLPDPRMKGHAFN